MKKIITTTITVIIVIFLVGFGIHKINKVQKINGMIMLVEFEKIEGILHWEKELDKRGMTALIGTQENVLKEYPAVFKRLAEKGYEIAGLCAGDPFWDMPYDKQYQFMKRTKETVESVTGKPMRVFGSRYFAYDENTPKIADDLGIDYILARGTQEIRAVIYSPLEYRTKIISVSNIVFEDMGSGSLCDYSLWARGATAEDFGKVVEEGILKNPDSMILVSHAYLGGTKVVWWKEYEKALSSDNVSWRSFDDWMKKVAVLKMNNAEIPENREVKYNTPKPAIPLEEMESIDLICQ